MRRAGGSDRPLTALEAPNRRSARTDLSGWDSSDMFASGPILSSALTSTFE